MSRRYCWRVGAVFDLAEGERCEECSSTDHLEIPNQSICGNNMLCLKDDRHGHACPLPAYHKGLCLRLDCTAEGGK